MNMVVGVKESSTKKLLKSAWADHVEKWEIKNWRLLTKNVVKEQ